MCVRAGAEWKYAGWEGTVYPNASSSNHPLLASVVLNCENGCLFDVVAGAWLLGGGAFVPRSLCVISLHTEKA